MLSWWTRVVVRAPWRIAAVALALFAVAAAGAVGVTGKLGGEAQFYDKRSESWQALKQNFAQGGPWSVPNVLVAVDRPTEKRLDEVAVALNDPGVLVTLDSLRFKVGALVDNIPDRLAMHSADGDLAALAVYLNYQGASAADLAEVLREIPGVRVGGSDLAQQERSSSIASDLLRAELIAFPLLFLLSLLLFRSPVAAIMPVVVGAGSIALTLLGLNIAVSITPLSQYILNVVTGLSLGLAIDYSLLVLWRYREEVALAGHGPEALGRTLETAGRTVAISAVTVAAALACLAVFPIGYLRSIGIAGAATALVSGAVALVVLPVLLTLLGRRIESLTPSRWRQTTERRADRSTTGAWYRIAHASMRLPVLTVLVAGALLLAIASPALDLKLGSITSADVPKGSEVGQVSREISAQLPVNVEEPVIAVASGLPRDQVEAFAKRLGKVDGVAAVFRPNRLPGGDTRIDMVVERGADIAAVVRDARALPGSESVLIGGASAAFVDQRTAIADRMPLAVALVAVLLFTLLFLATGSVILPVKALLMTALTVAAALGVMVFIFQEGRLEGLLAYDAKGSFDLTVPVLVVAFGIGLSTDYGIFLLSRIREIRAQGDVSEREAIALGLDRSGRIVSAAALLFLVAFGAFALARLTLIKEIGIGTAAAVIIDVTLVRALMVPALMALLGPWNWWAPGPLRRLHRRVGVWR